MQNNKLNTIYCKMLTLTDLMMNKLEQQAKDLGYHKSEFIIITDILQNPRTTLMDLCHRTGLKKSAASKVINQLIEKGVIDRSACETDRRALHLKITNPEISKTFCRQAMLADLFPNECEGKCDLDEIIESLEKLETILDNHDKV